MEILVILFLILVNGAFAMSEIAVVSSRPARLRRLARHDRAAATALDLHHSPNVFLSTIQIGITLIGILAGAIGEAAVADDVAGWLRSFPALADYSDGIALAIVVAGITYFSLVLGELVPKRLGLLRPERVARVVAPPMKMLARTAYPLVRVLSLSVDGVLHLLRVRTLPEPAITEEEIKTMIEEGTRSGVFLRTERDLLRNVIRLADMPIELVMTPRSEIEWLDADDPPDVNRRRLAGLRYSRLPLARGELDRAIGIVQTKDLLGHLLAGGEFDPAAVCRPVIRVGLDASPLRLLDIFKKSPLHMALVMSATGEVRGVVTLHDVLEAIVGGLPIEGEAPEPRIAQRADGSWLVDGMLSIEELKELLGVPRLPDEESADYETLAGFVLAQLDHVPRIGERLEWEGWRMEIMDMDGRRIDRVLIGRQRPSG
jgi:putative hemolysin